jgi:hypothetical protein
MGDCKTLFRVPPVFGRRRSNAAAVTWAIMRFFTPRQVHLPTLLPLLPLLPLLHSPLSAIPVWHQLAVLPASNLCLRAKTIRCSEAAGWCLDDIVLRWLPMPASAVPLSLSPVLTAVVSTLSLVCLC